MVKLENSKPICQNVCLEMRNISMSFEGVKTIVWTSTKKSGVLKMVRDKLFDGDLRKNVFPSGWKDGQEENAEKKFTPL